MKKTDNSDTIKGRRGDKDRPALKKRFLELLLDSNVLGNVSMAAKILGINRDTVYGWRSKDSRFAKYWEKQIQVANDSLADEAENALLKAIQAGNITAIIFTLKKRRPERWGDKIERLVEEPTHELSPEFSAFLENLGYTAFLSQKSSSISDSHKRH